MTHAALVVNPTAGKNRAGRLQRPVAEALRRPGLTVTEIIGNDAADALQRARAALAEGADALVTLGGDGMAHLGLQAVAGTDTPFGVVPAGTGNDLARSLGFDVKDPIGAARIIAGALAAGQTRPIDAVRASGKWFGCVMGAGFDSRVNDRANRMTWPRGQLRYNVAILAELRVFKPVAFTITVDDGEPWQTGAMLVAVGNAQSYGAGMRVCPGAQLDDGLIDVTVVGPLSKPEFLRVFPTVYKGTHVRHPAVTTLRGKRVTIEAAGVSAYADGEFLADLPVTCEVVPGAVRMLRP